MSAEDVTALIRTRILECQSDARQALRRSLGWCPSKAVD
jgi:hypothetical protein